MKKLIIVFIASLLFSSALLASSDESGQRAIGQDVELTHCGEMFDTLARPPVSLNKRPVKAEAVEENAPNAAIL
ncbi:MAG: hypothetical protein ISR65_09910 [Bacteriovoracaceae bacterium]|nr:hypothetical protein [Bacteriovoracaceae bacterium]